MDPNPRPSKLDRLRNRIRGISPLPVRTTTASSRAPSPISTCIGSPAPDASSTQQQPSSTAPQYLKTQAAAAAASLDSSATTGDAPRAPVIHPRVEPGQRIFDTAIRALSEEDQSTVKALVLHEELGNVKDVQDAVLAQKRTCEERRWTISVKGYNLGLGDVAGALSLLLDKIQPGINLVSQMAAVAKPGVDLAASIDPLHIGIPLALIKAALGVMIFTSEQMEKLLSGMIMTTFMLQQLSLYFEYFKQVDSPTEAKSLEDVLSSTYSLVFGFLLVGQCALSKRGPKRAFELLWSKNKVDEYERSCESAAQKLEMAANHCHRNGSHKQLRDMMGRIELIMSEMKRLDIVRATVQALNVKLDLHRLRPASGVGARDFLSPELRWALPIPNSLSLANRYFVWFERAEGPLVSPAADGAGKNRIGPALPCRSLLYLASLHLGTPAFCLSLYVFFHGEKDTLPRSWLGMFQSLFPNPHSFMFG